MKNGQPIYISLQKARSVYGQVLEENRIICINDVGKERDYAKQIRETLGLTRLINFMIIPIGKSVGKQGGGHVLILINRLAPESGEEESKGAAYENFNVHLTPCFKPIFKELLTHVIVHNDLNIAKNQDIADENLTLRTIDTIMATASTYEFIKQIEKNMAELFNCERANVVMVHR